jgi:inosine-uridine nucleoside N-ribohydrolase
MELKKKPVILDTDIGLDIDDTWALGMLLKSPELDVKLITTTNNDTTFKAKLVAKFLENVDRTDIPIGIGIKEKGPKGPLRKWVKDYDLVQYDGIIIDDGVSAIIDTIVNSSEPLELIAIGPLGNIASALNKNSEIINNSRYIGMQGAIRKFYEDMPDIKVEYNVAQNIPATKTVFYSEWDKTITPLDTCGVVKVSGNNFDLISESNDPTPSTIFEITKLWAKKRGFYNKMMEEKTTSTLFDPVAIYLAYSEEFLNIEELKIAVTDKGRTLEDKAGSLIRCAISWNNLKAFENHLTDRLLK